MTAEVLELSGYADGETDTAVPKIYPGDVRRAISEDDELDLLASLLPKFKQRIEANRENEGGEDPYCANSGSEIRSSSTCLSPIGLRRFLCFFSAALEAGYLHGASLGQTVYTCLYMQNLARLEDDLYLSAFCQALRATCSEVRTIIMMSCVCEEEDFNALCNGLELDHPEGNASACVLQQANKAEEILTQQSKKKTPQSQGGGLGSLPPLVARALLSRIRMRKALHMGLERAMKKTKQDLAQACKHFAAGLSEMEMIRSTAKLGAEIVPGFEKGLYQAPAPGGPVRVSQALTLDETWDRFENLLGEL
ncbi:hypothetical protein BSKO_14145 [Bryopsis sp. KO-2023]|nr:hypothetical protein BSKO_14145 [Bryopsis sp. KO-2023]